MYSSFTFFVILNVSGPVLDDSSQTSDRCCTALLGRFDWTDSKMGSFEKFVKTRKMRCYRNTPLEALHSKNSQAAAG